MDFKFLCQNKLFLSDYLFERHNDNMRGTERDLLSTGLFPKWSQEARVGLGRGQEPGIPLRSLPWVAEHKHSVICCCSSRHISTVLDQKQSSQDVRAAGVADSGLIHGTTTLTLALSILNLETLLGNREMVTSQVRSVNTSKDSFSQHAAIQDK